MLFNVPQFWVFFVFVALAYHAVPPTARRPVLLIASLVFYFVWIPVYLLLLLGDVLVNYVLMQRMVRSARPRRLLGLSIGFSLAVLGFFKYADFFAETASAVLRPLGLGEIPAPHVLLPLGISFYTFQIIAMQVDIHRGRLTPARSSSEYLLFLAFFPHSIAGPILRGAELLPQLRACARPTAEQLRRGAWLVTGGLLKKIVLADALLAPFADRAFSHPGVSGAPMALVAVYSFAFQIYFDFSGYTDIARGIAL